MHNQNYLIVKEGKLCLHCRSIGWIDFLQELSKWLLSLLKENMMLMSFDFLQHHIICSYSFYTHAKHERTVQFFVHALSLKIITY